MDIKAGDVVKSLAGHDSGKHFVVIATLNDKFVLIADGVRRKAEEPKQKNVKHLRKIGHIEFYSDTAADNDGIASKLDKLLQDINSGGANV